MGDGLDGLDEDRCMMEAGLRHVDEARGETAAVLVLSHLDRHGEEQGLSLMVECLALVARGLTRVATVLRRLPKVLELLDEGRILSGAERVRWVAALCTTDRVAGETAEDLLHSAAVPVGESKDRLLTPKALLLSSKVLLLLARHLRIPSQVHWLELRGRPPRFECLYP